MTRQTMKSFLVLLLSLVAWPSKAKHTALYVDAAAMENVDGSRERPFGRITDAVVRARALRHEDSRHEERIVIQVRTGTYRGSYQPTDLAHNPRLELLPIIL